ncbi:aspartate/glutamate/uridylate kinase [Benzoatithermus flavus]|uniref:Aspartate/glutamate/uridylate kinase domain-containing protein n=1 Tax=Benzoatithermus flavus TaxID=3108223 RepID=A0ABU8XPN8_9PROT
MWVVKLGGSLHDAPSLQAWLCRLVELPGPPRVVVPGGGPFADAVRELQPRLGFGDLPAHRMAILAMQQYGLHLQALEPRLDLAETEAELLAARAAVWLPWRLAGRDATLPASWDVTSDSLACWLAVRLGATALVLVKSAETPAGSHAPEALAAAGLLDPAFPGFVQDFAGTVLLAHRDRLPAALTLAGLGPACRVLPAHDASFSSAGSDASMIRRATR